MACNPDIIAFLWAVGMGLNLRKRTFTCIQAQLLEGRWENRSLFWLVWKRSRVPGFAHPAREGVT